MLLLFFKFKFVYFIVETFMLSYNINHIILIIWLYDYIVYLLLYRKKIFEYCIILSCLIFYLRILLICYGL